MKKLINIISACIISLVISLSLASETLANEKKSVEEKAKVVEKTQQKKKSEPELNIQESILENGLKIYVVQINTHGSVDMLLGYNVGSADDQLSTMGSSHFLEHMMFKGTKNISSEKLNNAVEKYNKYTNAFTNCDITCYVHKCNKVFLDIDLKIEADRMQNLALKKEDIEKERQVIIEERKMANSNPLTKYVQDAEMRALFLYSNYSYPIVGCIEQIKACDKKSLEKHYKKYYSPNNAFLLFVGDITKDEALAKAKKYFGHIKMGEEIKRERVIDPEYTGLTHSIDHSSKQISIHNLSLTYKINRNLIDTLKKHMIVDIMNSILADGCSSILYQNIVDKKELSYNIGSYLDVRAFDKGTLHISTVFRENTTDQIVEKEINSIVYNFAEKYLTKELFEKEKIKYLDQLDIMKDNPSNVQSLVLSNLVIGYKIEDINNAKKIINSVKIEDVKDVANKILTAENRILRVYTHPKEN